MSRLANLENRSSIFWMTVGCLVVSGVAIADVETGSEISFSFFYLIPIVLVAWFSGKALGLTVSVISSVAWYMADSLGGASYSYPAIRYWNAAVRLGFFVVVTLLLPALKALEREKEIARIDDLTGAANRRHLLEVAQNELERSRRYKHPFTIAYIDVDGFKAVNDRFGHQAGDELLCSIVRRAKSHLRKTDLLGRFGGDEFMLLLPEISHDAAQMTVKKIQSALQDEMGRCHWPVTFSIGAVTYQDGPMTADELIGRADDLMYSVKKKGRDAIACSVYAG